MTLVGFTSGRKAERIFKNKNRMSEVLVFLFSAQAGLLSGFPGIESVPGPQLPQIDFLTKFNGKM